MLQTSLIKPLYLNCTYMPLKFVSSSFASNIWLYGFLSHLQLSLVVRIPKYKEKGSLEVLCGDRTFVYHIFTLFICYELIILKCIKKICHVSNTPMPFLFSVTIFHDHLKGVIPIIDKTRLWHSTYNLFALKLILASYKTIYGIDRWRRIIARR